MSRQRLENRAATENLSALRSCGVTAFARAVRARSETTSGAVINSPVRSCRRYFHRRRRQPDPVPRYWGPADCASVRLARRLLLCASPARFETGYGHATEPENLLSAAAASTSGKHLGQAPRVSDRVHGDQLHGGLQPPVHRREGTAPPAGPDVDDQRGAAPGADVGIQRCLRPLVHRSRHDDLRPPGAGRCPRERRPDGSVRPRRDPVSGAGKPRSLRIPPKAPVNAGPPTRP